jgi:glutamyl/glutaminyl-tRNA synthetase
MEYKRLGYLPEAVVNFLALLGWSPGDDRELMSRQELTAAFSLEGISGGNAVFNTEKLDWMNSQYISRLSRESLLANVEPLLHEAGFWPPQPDDAQREWLIRVLDLLRPRVKRLTDFVEQSRPFLAARVDYEPEAVAKHLGTPGLGEHVATLVHALRTATPFDEPHVEAVVRGTAAERGLKPAVLIHATRVAVTGRTASPGLFEVLVLLGRDRVVERLQQLRTFLAARA